MKKFLLIPLFCIFIYSCSSSKVGNKKTRFFDEDNVEVSESKFYRIRSKRKLISIEGDSSNHKKLILREKRGEITNRPLLESLLEKELNREIDSNKPIVIIFYPGKDACNSSGLSTIISKKVWYKELEDGINQVAQIKPIYIYKDKEGLEEYDGVLTWHKDPEGLIEKLFFEYHYPCGSFVVVSKDGNYISYFGETGKEYVWEATQLMNK